jgi:hypothetical protein
MDRREFLKAVPAALACGAAVGKPAVADVLGESDGGSFPPFEPLEEGVAEEYRFAAAVFPSKAWGTSSWHMHFDKGCLSDVDRDFPHEKLIDIREGEFAFDAAKVPDLAIAVANPHDPDSWRAAQTQCAMVKRAGSILTLLFAAHPYPQYRYPFDPSTLTYEPEGGWMEGADVVVNFVTLNLREEFPRMVYALTHFDGGMPDIDLFDIREGLKGGKQAVYFCDTADGAKRAARATRFACNQLGRSSLARHGFNGGLVLMEANTWMLEELYEVAERFANALPGDATVVPGRVGHYDIDPWLTVHAIVTYTTA